MNSSFSGFFRAWLYRLRPLTVVALLLAAAGCGEGTTDAEGPGERGRAPGAATGRGGDEAPGGQNTRGEGPSTGGRETSGRPSGRPGGGGPPGGRSGGGPPPDRGVPVEAVRVERRPMASFFETQGTLEAENEVDLVARTSGPLTQLLTEEGRSVRAGQELARIDDRELRAQLEISRVSLEETRTAYERVSKLFDSQLVSQEAHDQALASYQSAQADFERTRVQLDYTVVTAPFGGLVVERYVKLAQNVGNGDRLFRLSDFDPLLCPIRVPERQLPRLSLGQRAELAVEAWPDHRFAARVLRVSPVVDAATGTVKVTLQVDGENRLRPGMFASVFLEMERNPEALVIPKAALALDSLGDTVFVVSEGAAARRSLTLGFQNQDLLEVREGLTEGEVVVTVGQEGLSDGTPVDVVSPAVADGEGRPAVPAQTAGAGPGRPGGGGPGGRAGGPGGFFAEIDWDDPEQVERVRERMRSRGLTEEQIEERLRMIRQRQSR